MTRATHVIPSPLYKRSSGSLILCLLCVIGLWSDLKGQMVPDTATLLSNIKTLSLIGKHYGDSIVLRWAPLSAETWYTQLHEPILVERREVSPLPGTYAPISDTIRLWPESKIEQVAASNADHPLLVVLLQNAYRDWENSLYDGHLASISEKADNFRNRWSLVLFSADRDALVAEAAGMRFVDRQAKKGVTYAYKVHIPGNVTAVDHKVIHPNIRTFSPMIYQGFQRDSSLVIQWQKHLHDAHYSAYHIERSEDGKTFTRLTELPYVQAYSNDPHLQSHFYTYTDRVANGKTFYYRLIGLDAFGDESQPSLAVSLKARDLQPPMPVQVSARVDSLQKGVVITWSHPDISDVKNLQVWYAEGGEDAIPVSEILPSSSTSFFYPPEDFNGIGKYFVTAADADGNISRSSEVILRVPDFTPPATPVFHEAIIDTTGLIRIRWEAATEKDVIGYFVYAADGEERHFQRLTPRLYPFTQFTDTVDLHTLTEKRYYKIVAVDDALNYSPLSKEIEVDRPDIMPPSPAWIQAFDLTDTSVILHLITSSSRDVVRHDVLRKSSNQQAWTTLASLTDLPSSTRYEDTTVEAGQKYIYTVMALDEQGLSSGIISEKHLLTPINRSADLQQCALSRDSDGIPMISWKHHEGHQAVLIYIQNKSTWQLVKEIPSTELHYKLPNYQDEPLMTKFIYADGSRSSAIVLTQSSN